MTVNSPLIELHGVARRYQVGPATVTALDSVDLRVDEGEFIVVLGPSGSGKTTLLNVIGALDTPTEGRIVVGGQDISTASRGQLFNFRRRTVSFIFQSFNLFPGLTARENVEFGIDASGRRERSEAVQVLQDVGLGSRISSPAVSSSASPSPALSPPTIQSSWPTSPRVSWTSIPARRSSSCSVPKPGPATPSWSSPTIAKSPASPIA